jgi:hypothetical protein
MPMVTHRIIRIELEFQDDSVTPAGRVLDRRLEQVAALPGAHIVAAHIDSGMHRGPITDRSHYREPT